MDIQNIFTFSHRVELYLPSKKSDGTELDASTRDSVELELGKKLTELFGGATASEAAGFYQHLDGRMSLERISIIYSFVEKLDESVLQHLFSLAAYVKDILSQESVLITIDGKAYLI